jgi:hypothetical protein
MALTKETVVDKVEVLENGNIQVRTATRIVEDGEIISSSYHRNVLNPADDLTGQNPKVVAIANAIWTPEVVAAYQAQQEANKLVAPAAE